MSAYKDKDGCPPSVALPWQISVSMRGDTVLSFGWPVLRESRRGDTNPARGTDAVGSH
jgi:hypothetical protein